MIDLTVSVSHRPCCRSQKNETDSSATNSQEKVMKFSLAPSNVTAFESRILVIVSYAVTFVMFAALFNGASAHAGGQPSNGNHSTQSIAELESGSENNDNVPTFADTTAAIGQSTAPVQDAPIQSDATRPIVERINEIRRL